MISDIIIRVENLERRLRQGGRELQVLRGLSFSVQAGSWLCLTGPSGAGKSTLLGLLAGIDRPSAGKIYFEGTELTALPERRMARLRNEKIGIVFQSFHLIPSLTALENVEAPLYIHPERRKARSKAMEMLELVGLGNRMKHYPHQLSGGEQQRVALARALVCGPHVLLADEPTGNLDSATGMQIISLLRRLRIELGLTLILATHDPALAAQADDRLHLVDGRLVEPERPLAASVHRALASGWVS